MKKETISIIAIELLKSDDWNEINMGMFGMLDNIYKQCVKRKVIKDHKHHPLYRQAYIMAQLRKSRLFKNVGHIDYSGFGRAYSNCAVMEIIN